MKGEGASRWHSWIHNIVSGFWRAPNTSGMCSKKCRIGQHSPAELRHYRAGGQCCSKKRTLGWWDPVSIQSSSSFQAWWVQGHRRDVVMQPWLVSPPNFGFFWQQDGLHGTRCAGIRWGGMLLPSAPLLWHSPTAVWCKKWPELGLYAAGICSWWGEQWHSAFIRRQKWHTRTSEGTFSTVSEGKVQALFLSQMSSLFLVHGTCQPSKD